MHGPLVELEDLLKHAASDGEEGLLVSELREQCMRLYHNRAVFKLMQNDGHVDLCRSLLSSAQDYCIIHSAFWSDAGINQYREEILGALNREVDVYLLRGLGDDEDSTVLTSLDQLMADAAGCDARLFISKTPHHSHAKFVVADGRTAIVSSFNFLGAARGNPQFNVGVCCTAPAGNQGVGLAVLRDLLEHALPGDLLSHLEEEVSRQELVARPIDSEQPFPGPDELATVREWIDMLREPQCACELIANEGHRDALLAALHTAERSVTITSGDLTRSAMDSVVLGYLKEALGRGVIIKVLWGTQTRDPDEQAEMAAFATELRPTLADDKFVINVVRQPVHAKLLIVDGWVTIVSSYNFLSYRGLRFGAHELGVKIYSLALGHELERMVNEALAK